MKRLLMLVVLLAACGREGPGEPPPEVLARKREAARLACAADELARRSADDLEMLDVSRGGEAGEALHRATMAAFEFSRAYDQHSQLRHSAYAYQDSAFNHARRASDSTRYVQRGELFEITVPRSGTLEANAIASYERKLAAILDDPDHRCNWDLGGL